ncbi:ATP-binding protein [Sedimentibacter sp.]|uniref:ATP-binding protein n=1 Tax=Sedimentibacter sp. TaxID=1960295 RepID=UPI00289E2550|nr:ATP-binding protein [Sedimentibacter sp.]
MRNIDLPPYAPMLIESTRAIGYSLEAAIADIIDNSITAKAKNISLRFLPYSDPYIAIIDDGIGMDEDKLTESMRYGCADPNGIRESNDMGRYGLGLKTASLSQCRSLTVVTKCNNTLFGRQWDLEHIKATGQWSLLALDEDEMLQLPLIEELNAHESGTLVLWRNLDKIFAGEINVEDAMTEKMDMASKHLSLVFHRFLAGGDAEQKISLIMNGDIIKGFDPFFTTKSRPAMDEERIDIPQFNSSVGVYPFVLPHPSKMTKDEIEKYGGKDGLRSLQGFYVYRNKRLLIWGTWFRLTRMDEFSKLARVRIDIPNSLDALWTLDVKKSTAMPPEIVKTRLKQIIKKIVDNSKRTYTFRGKKETRDDITHVWNVMETREGVRYELNGDYPLLDKLSEIIDDEAKKLLDDYLYSIESNFPVNRMQNDIYNEKKIVKDNNDAQFNNIKSQLGIFIDAAENRKDREQIISMLSKTEPFCDYIDRIKEIVMEDEDDEEV